MTFANEKFLTARLRPLTLAALSTLGGGIFTLLVAFSLSKVDVLSRVPIGFVALGIIGGIINLGIGQALYLWFLRSVEVTKASPVIFGFQSLLALLSGVVLLGESLSYLALTGIFFIIGGIYCLSFAQQASPSSRLARPLGFRGNLFLAALSLIWTSGATGQGLAIDEVGPVLLNLTRLIAVTIFLAILLFLGLNRRLMRGSQILRHPPVDNDSLLTSHTPSSATRVGWRIGDIGRRPMMFAFANGAIYHGVAGSLWLLALQKVGLAIASILGSTMILWLALFSAILLRESVGLKTVFGMVAVFAGITLVLL